ncbi:FAD/NAD(P)-binding domain-containing protein [Pleomassaria siparia CBS 279.74]|uniref:FAD/NAD(P)-binding domain-containing protein n=1 Tax=Pleomassaria siparia CBS 279.74 TaxID=1314801 RepID=A0A6G1K157_9PLEO|nr:FAD/NAD(P)-binding domain-containing protein [Pleomassaria siparia CBS 279.74]
MPHVEIPNLHVPDDPQCAPQPIRIIHVGMGASGLLCAHKSRRFLRNYTIVCYEKNDDIGGTWYENRYPGCACDIPAHTYTFPFEGNPDWSGYYSYAPEIQEYMMRFYRRHRLEPFVVLQTKVVAATWDGGKGVWEVELERRDGSRFTDTCNVLINGSGVLTKWKWPDIPGLHDFKGTLAHSANWPQDLDWAGKRVAVIGTGSSSIQMVPKIAETAEHVTVFMRNCTYITPQFGSNITNTEADADAMDPQAAGKHQYTEKEKQRFRDDPAYHLKYRTDVERAVANGAWDMFYRGSELNLATKAEMQASMAARLGDREDLKKYLIPTWSPGCRRLTPGEGYLEALIRSNVTCVMGDAITSITSTGPVTESGAHHVVDILACATGFAVQYLPHFPIRGIDSQLMQDQTEPNIYASIAAPGFPNYFVINGPRGNWGQGCALPSHEVQMEYILQIARHMQEDRIKSIQPKQRITDQLNRYMDAWHSKHSIWQEDCKSWYKTNARDGRVYIWPGSLLHHLKFLKHVRYEHYDIEYVDEENIFQFLGNGKTIGQVKYGKDAPVPYIRNEEAAEWDIE